MQQTPLCNAEPRPFDVDCHIAYDVPAPAHFRLHIHSARTWDQEILGESLVLVPEVASRLHFDQVTGNVFLRFSVAPGPLTIRYRATVRVLCEPHDESAGESPVEALPDEVLSYLIPTRYCESDRLMHAALDLFGRVAPGYSRVAAITEWVRNNIEYRVGTSTPTTSALDVFVSRVGVCRDFAHLAITFCRALNIPARLVVGYVKFDDPPPDFHAIFEAWLGGRWMRFDPTGLAPVERLVRVGTGHDCKDVAFATIFGPAIMRSLTPVIEPSSGRPIQTTMGAPAAESA